MAPLRVSRRTESRKERPDSLVLNSVSAASSSALSLQQQQQLQQQQHITAHDKKVAPYNKSKTPTLNQ